MLNYNIDDVEVTRAIRRLYKKSPELRRRILSYIGEAVVNRTVEHHLTGQTLKRQTGTLAKSINYRLKNDDVVRVGTNVAYAAIHEFGGEIHAKNAAYLRFKVKDQWIMAKKVTIPKRPYLWPSVEWVMNNEADKIFNKQAQQWLDKEFTDRS
jgi:phage gpG-like protein